MVVMVVASRVMMVVLVMVMLMIMIPWARLIVVMVMTMAVAMAQRLVVRSKRGGIGVVLNIVCEVGTLMRILAVVGVPVMIARVVVKVMATAVALRLLTEISRGLHEALLVVDEVGGGRIAWPLFSPSHFPSYSTEGDEAAWESDFLVAVAWHGSYLMKTARGYEWCWGSASDTEEY